MRQLHMQYDCFAGFCITHRLLYSVFCLLAEPGVPLMRSESTRDQPSQFGTIL